MKYLSIQNLGINSTLWINLSKNCILNKRNHTQILIKQAKLINNDNSQKGIDSGRDEIDQRGAYCNVVK